MLRVGIPALSHLRSRLGSSDHIPGLERLDVGWLRYQNRLFKSDYPELHASRSLSA